MNHKHFEPEVPLLWDMQRSCSRIVYSCLYYKFLRFLYMYHSSSKNELSAMEKWNCIFNVVCIYHLASESCV